MTASHLRRLTYALEFASLGLGIATLPFNGRLALLPVAVAFGWSQIGGL
jgi:hypothetical protein